MAGIADLELRGRDVSWSQTIHQAGSKLEVLAKQASATGLNLQNGFAAAKGAVLGLASAYGVLQAGQLAYNFLKSSIDDAAAAELEFKRLAATLRATGQGGQEAVDGVEKWALALQRATGISDETFLSATNRMLTFGKTIDQAKRMVTLATEMAPSFGGFEASLSTLQRVANGHFNLLTRTGQITKEEIEKTGGSIDKVFDLLEKRVTGSAKASLETYAGQLQLLGNEFGELKETIGTKMLPAVTGWLTNINDMIAGHRALALSIEEIGKSVDKVELQRALKEKQERLDWKNKWDNISGYELLVGGQYAFAQRQALATEIEAIKKQLAELDAPVYGPPKPAVINLFGDVETEEEKEARKAREKAAEELAKARAEARAAADAAIDVHRYNGKQFWESTNAAWKERQQQYAEAERNFAKPGVHLTREQMMIGRAVELRNLQEMEPYDRAMEESRLQAERAATEKLNAAADMMEAAARVSKEYYDDLAMKGALKGLSLGGPQTPFEPGYNLGINWDATDEMGEVVNLPAPTIGEFRLGDFSAGVKEWSDAEIAAIRASRAERDQNEQELLDIRKQNIREWSIAATRASSAIAYAQKRDFAGMFDQIAQIDFTKLVDNKGAPLMTSQQAGYAGILLQTAGGIAAGAQANNPGQVVGSVGQGILSAGVMSGNPYIIAAGAVITVASAFIGDPGPGTFGGKSRDALEKTLRRNGLSPGWDDINSDEAKKAQAAVDATMETGVWAKWAQKLSGAWKEVGGGAALLYDGLGKLNLTMGENALVVGDMIAKQEKLTAAQGAQIAAQEGLIANAIMSARTLSDLALVYGEATDILETKQRLQQQMMAAAREYYEYVRGGGEYETGEAFGDLTRINKDLVNVYGREAILTREAERAQVQALMEQNEELSDGQAQKIVDDNKSTRNIMSDQLFWLRVIAKDAKKGDRDIPGPDVPKNPVISVPNRHYGYVPANPSDHREEDVRILKSEYVLKPEQLAMRVNDAYKLGRDSGFVRDVMGQRDSYQPTGPIVIRLQVDGKTMALAVHESTKTLQRQGRI